MKNPMSLGILNGQQGGKTPSFRGIRLTDPDFPGRIRARHRKMGGRSRRPQMFLALRPSSVSGGSRLFAQHLYYPYYPCLAAGPIDFTGMLNLRISFSPTLERSGSPPARRPAGSPGLAGRGLTLFHGHLFSRGFQDKRNFQEK